MKPRVHKTSCRRTLEADCLAGQLAGLRRFLRDTVLPFSANYRRLFAEHELHADDIRSWDDWARVPFTSKDDLVSTPEQKQRIRDFILMPDEKLLARRPSTILRAVLTGRTALKRHFEREFRPVFMTSTTGRSAEPIPFLYSQFDLDLLAETGRRVFDTCGAARDMRLLNLFPYAPHLAFWLTHYGAASFGVFMASTGGGKVMGTEASLRMLRKINPDVLIGMPTFAYHVLQQAAETGLRCKTLRRLVLGGEKVPYGLRRKLDTLARELGSPGVEVLSTYGFTEARTAWAECPAPLEEPSGFHLHPDLGLIEIIDPDTGAVLPPGLPGEIVFTPLTGRGTVVLRYRTGDLIDGGLTYEPCPHCGRTGPRLIGHISRRSEFRSLHIEKLKGTLVDFNQLEHVLDDAPLIGAWQIELRKRNDDPLDTDELILHVHALNGGNHEDIARELSQRFASRTEIRPNRVLFHDADEMRRLQGVGVEMKERRLVDHRTDASPSPIVRRGERAGVRGDARSDTSNAPLKTAELEDARP
jgi:phenylacetate-CoA ligase